MKQDCAGYTFQKIFNKGMYWITAQEFYDKLIIFYGRQIRSLADPFGWGDVQKGDVLVYRKGGSVNHITYVSGVNTTLGVVTSVVIDTKDGKEGVYKHKIGLMNEQTDPLIRAMGEIWVYRLDPGKMQVTEVSRTCDCDLMDSKGPGWILESFTVDPDKKSGKWGENLINYHIGCTKGWNFYLTNLKSLLEGGIDLRNRNKGLKEVINS